MRLFAPPPDCIKAAIRGRGVSEGLCTGLKQISIHEEEREEIAPQYFFTAAAKANQSAIEASPKPPSSRKVGP